MTAAQEPVFTVGSLITGQPWENGRELDPRRGIVIGHQFDEWLVVWYPSLGEICRDEDGHAVQITLVSKAVPDGHIRDWTLLGLRRLQLRVLRGGGHSRGQHLLSAIAVAAMGRAATARTTGQGMTRE